jgi:outer membrane receptor protein involved in Fe transport
MKQYRRTPVARSVSAVLAGSALVAATPVYAQDEESSAPLEEIVVTAQKREQSLQDVPVSIQVLGNEQLEQLNLQNFAEYIEFLPTVSFISARPGVSQVYMRGISSGGDGNHSASLPSVGVYLDEQPITTINEVLDLHMYDIARIETLAGPQGTFFGASSQAGTVRIITNKPVIGETQAGFDVAANFVSEGDVGYSLEGFANLPISDRMAVRLVGWHIEQAGYIDNVNRQVTMQGVGVTHDNAPLVEEDFNSSTTSGARALLKIDLNDNWTLTPGIIYQQQDTDGAFTHDPEDIGDLQAARFYPEFYDDSWYQASLTLEGDIGGYEFVYAGAYFDRDREALDDYTHYAQYLDNYYEWYYQTYYYTGGCYHLDSQYECTDPSQFITPDENFNKQSHELRLMSPQDRRFRWMLGLFVQRQEHDFDLRWSVPDMDPDFGPTRTWPLGTVVLETNTVWQTKQVRTDRDQAVFGELNFDITDNLTFIGGVRWFDFENSLYGFNGGLNRCLDDQDLPQYPCFDAPNIDAVSEGDGNTVKVSLNYNVTGDAMLYATYSEGFRPGGVNRTAVPGFGKYDPDFVDNYEIGWKTTLADGRLRFNGAAYYLEWDDFQFSFLDFSISPLTIIQNVGQSETTGFEFDTVFAASDALTLSFAASYNKAELAEPYWRTSDERDQGDPPRAPAGTAMPFVPEWQGTATGRYDFLDTRWPAYLQAAISYTGDSWSNLEIDLREKQASYTIVNLAAGMQFNAWHVDLFLDNVTDERAEIVRYGAGYFDPFGEIFQDTEITVNRPFTVGLRVGRRF